MIQKKRSIFKQVTRFIFYSNIHIALLAAGLTWTNLRQFDSDHPSIIFFNFFAALFIYNLDRLWAVSSDQISAPDRTHFVVQNKFYFIVGTIVCLPAIIILLLFMSRNFLIASVVLALVTLLYLLVFNAILPSIVARFPLLKPALLSLVWTLATLLLPVVDEFKKIRAHEIVLPLILRFIEYFANGVFFDYRDRISDKLFQRSNMFSRWSVGSIFTSLAIFLTLIMTLSVAVICLNTISLISLADFIVISLFVIFSWFFAANNSLIRKKIDKNNLLYPAIFDGILFLPVLAALLMELRSPA